MDPNIKAIAHSLLRYGFHKPIIGIEQAERLEALLLDRLKAFNAKVERIKKTYRDNIAPEKNEGSSREAARRP